ncbi:hypothetical protein SDJN02_10858, partial [Cucurbita argyrosperma subsp. argyrosperma]
MPSSSVWKVHCDSYRGLNNSMTPEVSSLRVYFSKTKPGLDPPHQAATTSATSVIHAWRCKFLACLGWIRIHPRPCHWDFLTHPHKGTDTHFTSHWVGNAAVGTTSSILEPYLHVQKHRVGLPFFWFM